MTSPFLTERVVRNGTAHYFAAAVDDRGYLQVAKWSATEGPRLSSWFVTRGIPYVIECAYVELDNWRKGLPSATDTE